MHMPHHSSCSHCQAPQLAVIAAFVTDSRVCARMHLCNLHLPVHTYTYHPTVLFLVTTKHQAMQPAIISHSAKQQTLVRTACFLPTKLYAYTHMPPQCLHKARGMQPGSLYILHTSLVSTTVGSLLYHYPAADMQTFAFTGLPGKASRTPTHSDKLSASVLHCQQQRMYEQAKPTILFHKARGMQPKSLQSYTQPSSTAHGNCCLCY